jgi:hypothetical protein
VPALPILIAALALAQPGGDRWSQSIPPGRGPRPPARVGNNNNAASDYFRVWDSITTQELLALSTACAEVHDLNTLTPERRELLNRHASFVNDLIAATGTTDCDWGVAYDEGWNMLLPHLGTCRQSSRILRADAIRCLREGSMIAAIERIRAMLRLSVHSARDGLLICTLLGVAIGAQATDAAAYLLDTGKVTPAHARMLLAAFREIPRTNFYNISTAIENELAVTLRWLSTECNGDNAGYKFGRLLATFDPSFGSPLNPVYGLNEQQFWAHVDRAARYFQEISKAMLLPDGGARVEELEMELLEYQHGLVAVAVTPPMSRARQALLTLQKRFDAMERRLQDLGRSE